MPAAFFVGQKVRAGQLANLIQGFTGTCTASLTLSTTPTDVAGATVTLNVTGNNAYAMVTGSAEFSVTGAAAVALNCSLYLDGVDQFALGTIRDTADQIHDRVHSYTWRIPLTAGSHTLKLRGSKAAALGTAAITNSAGTNIIVQLFDRP